MRDYLEILLRIGGCGLLLLTFLHIPIGKALNWNEDGKNLTPVNEQIFHVHTFFICLCLLLMGLASMFAPQIFLDRSEAGLWIAGCLCAFWVVRLFFQFFVYKPEHWRGKRMEAFVHWWFAFVWLALASVYGACFLVQLGLLD